MEKHTKRYRLVYKNQRKNNHKFLVFKIRENLLLFDNNEAWMEKGSRLFDVNMCAFDRAKVCELVGTFLLYKPSEPISFHWHHMGSGVVLVLSNM